MARTGFLHSIGSFLLFAAFFLLFLASISSPSVHELSLLRVRLKNNVGTFVTFGPFGYCILDAVGSTGIDRFDICSKSKVGYRPIRAIQAIDGVNYRRLGSGSQDNLTKALILHPIACGLAFFAFTISIGAGFFGSLFAAYVASIAWLLTLVTMSINFSIFNSLKNRINMDGSGSHAVFGPAIWFVLTAFFCLFYGMSIVFLTCCSARLHSVGRKPKEVAASASEEEVEAEEVEVEEKTGKGKKIFDKLMGFL